MTLFAFAISATHAFHAASTSPLPSPTTTYAASITANGGRTAMTKNGIRWHAGPMMAMPRWPKLMCILFTSAVASVYPANGVTKTSDTTVLETWYVSMNYNVKR